MASVGVRLCVCIVTPNDDSGCGCPVPKTTGRLLKRRGPPPLLHPGSAAAAAADVG